MRYLSEQMDILEITHGHSQRGVCSRDTYYYCKRHESWHLPMTAKKRDQPRHVWVRQYLPGLIPDTVLGIIRGLGGPYDTKPGLGGMTVYPPSAMGIVYIMLGAEYTTCRKMVRILRNNHAMAAKICGGCTRCRRPDNRAREISICATCYDIELVARLHVKDGRLTQDQIATLAT